MIIWVLGTLCIGLIIACIFLWQRGNTTVQLNEKTQAQNVEIARENENLKVQNSELEKNLATTKESIKAQSNILQSLTSTSNQMKENAEARAQEVYQARLEALETNLSAYRVQEEQKLVDALAVMEKKVKQEQDKLNDLEAKQLAFVQAKQREEEIEAQKDYYRMVISDDYLEDIQLLRGIQSQLRKKDAVDKVIYETYYRQAYDLLMSHLFPAQKVCGIYKITNIENGQAYIGQSVDIKERFRTHVKTALSSAPSTNKLYQQMKKYGPENFTFEILEPVAREKLNERETYWIDFYKTKDFGLNGTKGGS